VAFDTDGDRVFFFDKTGERVSSHIIGSLLARYYLNKYPGASIISDVRMPKIFAETVVENGGKHLGNRVGHAFIKKRMHEEGAVFAAEVSGHFYFRDNYFADSSTIAGLLMLEFLAEKKNKLSEIRQKYEKYVSSGEINFEVDTPDTFLDNLTEYYTKRNPDLIDGVTVDFGSWWFNVRSSKTEALVRLNMEAENRQLFKEKLTDIMAVLQELGAREKKG